MLEEWVGKAVCEIGKRRSLRSHLAGGDDLALKGDPVLLGE